MSTVMYAYRIDKDAFWDWHATAHAFYLAHSPLAEQTALLVADPDPMAYYHARQAGDLDELTVEVQLFDEGDTWLLRPLERGHQFHEAVEEEGWPLTPVFYDNRTDDDLDEGNHEVAVWVDERISAGAYLTASLVSLFTAEMHVYDTRRRASP